MYVPSVIIIPGKNLDCTIIYQDQDLTVTDRLRLPTTYHPICDPSVESLYTYKAFHVVFSYFKLGFVGLEMDRHSMNWLDGTILGGM